jgi:predicted  nucleic acid-binding Zn-ribbon protein
MLERLLTSVVASIFSAITNAITDWLRQKEVEALRARSATLEGKLESMKSTGATEKQIASVVKEKARINNRAASIKDKLKALADHAAGEEKESEELSVN